MHDSKRTSNTQLAQRLKLASQHQNMGQDMTTKDYAWLFVVTVLAPAAMMLVGWNL